MMDFLLFILSSSLYYYFFLFRRKKVWSLLLRITASVVLSTKQSFIPEPNDNSHNNDVSKCNMPNNIII